MDNDGFRNPATQLNDDYGFHDFNNEGNLGQFIDLIRGQNTEPITNFNPAYDAAAAAELLFYGGLVENQFCTSSTTTTTPPQGNMFDFNSINTSDPEYILNGLPLLGGEDVGFEMEDDEYDEDDSSATTNNGLSQGSKADRSKTLVSERRRRGRMKEKLYALRSLVPNITKMDTASIVGDAVEYVRCLQTEARNLKAEIAGLRSSLKCGEGTPQDLGDNPKKAQAGEKKNPSSKKIVQMGVFQEEERGYYVRLACNNGEGVVVALHKALESLTRFDVQRSNFSVASERSVMTFKLNVKDRGEEMNMSTLKIWVTGALLNQGFEFKTPVAS